MGTVRQEREADLSPFSIANVRIRLTLFLGPVEEGRHPRREARVAVIESAFGVESYGLVVRLDAAQQGCGAS
jgi:hypothetical protein